MAKETVKRITSIGGQALLEGVLMRGPKETSIAVRMSDGTITNEPLEMEFLKDKCKFFQLPLVRGVIALIDSMRMGYRAIKISAEKAGVDLDEPSKFDMWLEKVFGDKLMNIIVFIATVLGIGLAMLLFFVLPTWLFNLCSGHFEVLNSAMIYRSLFEGILRIIIFLLYIVLCSQMNEMKRVFQYHGAEHKTIFCYENEEELTVENVKKHSRFHPRCGTSFMVIMLILGIIVGLFIPATQPLVRSAIKILCIPVIMGFGYELIRICGKYDNAVTRAISAPGMWMQRITTKEPDDGMIEVAIEAIKAVIPENGEDIIER